jgi:dienelactone hydrolase
MTSETFKSGGKDLKITVFPTPGDGKRHPIVLLIHGNFGLGPPYGDQIRDFGKRLAELGYVAAVPQLYADEASHLDDMDPDRHVGTLSAAIAAVAARLDADPDRVGLVGFSLGAAVAMTYVASGTPGPVKALADFFGPLTAMIRAGVGKFPPTIIFHNNNDAVVPVGFSVELDSLLPSTVQRRLVRYDELSPPGNHAFRPGGEADRDSLEKTKNWFTSHIPPVGR